MVLSIERTMRRWPRLLALLLSGCTCAEGPREETPAPPDEPTATADPMAAYEVAEVVNGGTITGTVSWSGERPAETPERGRGIAAPCGAVRPLSSLAVSRQGGVSDTVVSLEGVHRGRGMPANPAAQVLAVHACSVEPRVVALAVGTPLSLRLSGGTRVQVHAFRRQGRRPENPWFSVTLEEGIPTHEVPLDEAGLSRLAGDERSAGLVGWVHALSHPYFAVTDAEGRFQIAGIPPGQYVLRAWHEGIRWTGQDPGGPVGGSAPIVLARPVTITVGHDTTVDFVIGPDDAAAAGD